MMKRLFGCLMVLVVGLSALTGCNGGSPSQSSGEAAAEENAMQYVTKEDLKDNMDGYVILDVRKQEDYDTQHIVGAYSADVDAAREGDDESGIANLKAGLSAATGSETGGADDKIVLVCYSGKAYAQKATDLLIGMGLNKDNIYTLEGGNNGWSEGGDEYTGLME